MEGTNSCNHSMSSSGYHIEMLGTASLIHDGCAEVALPVRMFFGRPAQLIVGVVLKATEPLVAESA